jgi:hypothetical protein
VCAAALAYRDVGDAQSLDIGAELSLLGAAETLAAIAGLDPTDALVRAVAERHAEAHAPRGAEMLIGAGR